MTTKKLQFKPKSHKDITGIREKGDKWTGNILRYYAEKLYERNVTSLEEIWNIDMTNKFFKEIDRQIKNKEIVKIQINAKPRLGKSTVAIVLAMWILNLINEYYPNLCVHKNFSMKNLCRDDQEKTKAMRNPDLMYTILVSDEANALEATGENATTEKAQKDVFSDVQAGRYIHNIDVCPEGEIDKNSDIKLEVRNREKGMSHCYLKFKINDTWMPLGFVDINVSGLIKQWQRTEPRFMMYLRDKKDTDRKYLEYWRKRDFYVEYMIKKYEKMELMNREGVLRPRELDYAGVVLNVFNRVKGLVKIMNINQVKGAVQSYVELEFKSQRLPVSMIGIDQSTKRVMAVLIVLKSQVDIEKTIKKNLKLLQSGKMPEDKYNEEMVELQEHKEELENLMNILIDEMKRYQYINEKYNSHTD